MTGSQVVLLNEWLAPGGAPRRTETAGGMQRAFAGAPDEAVTRVRFDALAAAPTNASPPRT